MSKKSIIPEVAAQAQNRRSFVRKLGLASASVGAAALAGGKASAAPENDADILNFALNLEYLEAEFYTIGLTGNEIAQVGVNITGTGTPGPTTGGRQVPGLYEIFRVTDIVRELGNTERTHVLLLQDAIAFLGGQAIAKPAINLAALGFGFNNVVEFLTLARIFEEIGVTAYGGAAPSLFNHTIIGAAARILATEAEHVGNIRYLMAEKSYPSQPLDGADVLPPPSGSQYFSTNSYAVTAVRTPAQVLYLAYGNAPNASGGGFFPNGVNGLYTISSAAPAVADTGISLVPPPV